MERTVNIMERNMQHSTFRKRESRIERKSMSSSKFLVNNEEPLAIFKDEAGLGVYNYYEEIGVFQLKNIVVLSSKHHFFFDYDKVHTSELVVNLTAANKISDLETFVSNLGRMMKDGNYYIGCFEDFGLSKNEGASRLTSSTNGFFHKFMPEIPGVKYLYYMSTQGHTKYLTIKGISKIFRSKGFRIVTAQTFDGKTFFMVRKSEVGN